MEFGMNQEKDGTWPSQAGSRIPSGLTWHCMQANAVRSAISNLGQSIQTDTKFESTGHDAGDEDPNAWT